MATIKRSRINEIIKEEINEEIKYLPILKLIRTDLIKLMKNKPKKLSIVYHVDGKSTLERAINLKVS